MLAASTSQLYVRDGLAQQAPNSSGTEPAKLKAPASACDCHHHIYDAARFPVRAGSRVIANARVEDYRLLQRRIGTSRNIVVTPIGFPATLAENLVTLDAIKQASGNARGVAIINPTISNADLQTLHDGGVRGIRFSSTGGSVPAAIAKEIEPLAKRVADLGWHVQINIEAGPILELEDLWNRLPATLVIDHMGHIRQPQGVEDPAFTYILRLIDKGGETVDHLRQQQRWPSCYADVNKVAKPMLKPPPSAWFGARIGCIRTRSISQTMPCCSTNSHSGPPRRPSATVLFAPAITFIRRRRRDWQGRVPVPTGMGDVKTGTCSWARKVPTLCQ